MSIPKLRIGASAFVLWVAMFSVLALPAQAAPPEEPVTEKATSVTATEATLNGELNPGASATTGFQFSYNTNGTCTEGPLTELQPEQTGKAIKVSSPLTGLVPSTTYTFCLLATHLEGETTETTSGGTQSFKTAALAPEVVSQSSSSILPFSATVSAEVNPENQTTTSCVFEYGTTILYGSSKPCEPETLEGFGGQSVSHTLTGLEGGTTYHFHVVVENATGKTEGPDQEFTTLAAEAPTVSNESAKEIGSTDVRLAATVNPNSQETTYAFEYATNETLTGATVIPGESPLPAVAEEKPVGPIHVTGLAPVTTYYYRVSATDTTGTTHGPIQSFTTRDRPLATTAPATAPTRTGASLSGTVNPDGASSTYHFLYVPAAGYQPGAPNRYVQGASTVESASVGSDYSVHAAGPVAIDGLRPGTTYHFAIVATNSFGSTTGSDMTFTTSPATPPLASTGEPTGVSQLSATLTGNVDTGGLPSTLQFEFGTVPFAGSILPASTGSPSGTLIPVSLSFAGDLAPDTTYYYRVIATNADGTSYGSDLSFTTPGFPAAPATAPAQLIGWPGFVGTELAAGPPHEPVGTGPAPLTKAQKLAKALKACAKKPKRKRAACRRLAKRRYR